MTRKTAVVLGLALCFLYLPIAVLAIFSFNSSSLMAFPLSGITFRWYVELAGNAAFLNGLATSLIVAQPVGLLTMILGLMAALALTSVDIKRRVAFASLLLIPFLVPKSVLSIAQAMVMSRIGLPRGLVALILAQTLVALPFAAALLASVLVRFDNRLVDAARDLGATPWQAFGQVTLPQIRGALAGAFSVGVILSLSDLTIATFLAGRAQPLSLIVASQFRRELRPDLNAMQVVILGVTAALVVTSEVFRFRKSRRRMQGELS